MVGLGEMERGWSRGQRKVNHKAKMAERKVQRVGKMDGGNIKEIKLEFRRSGVALRRRAEQDTLFNFNCS